MYSPRIDQFRPADKKLLFSQRNQTLNCLLTGGGYHHVKGRIYDYHGLQRKGRECAAFQYTVAGHGCLRFGDRHYDLYPGSLMIVYFPHNHRYWLPKGDSWSFFYLSMEGEEPRRIWEQIISETGPMLRCDWNSQLIQCAAEVCLDVTKEQIRSPWQASIAAYTVAMKLMEFSKTRPELASPSRPHSVDRAICYCRENLCKAIGLKEMALAAGYSRHHFSRIFKEATGLSPVNFIRKERMERARHLLLNTEDPVFIISEECGFRDPNYFIRSFRNHYGITPLVARRRSGRP